VEGKSRGGLAKGDSSRGSKSCGERKRQYGKKEKRWTKPPCSSRQARPASREKGRADDKGRAGRGESFRNPRKKKGRGQGYGVRRRGASEKTTEEMKRGKGGKKRSKGPEGSLWLAE